MRLGIYKFGNIVQDIRKLKKLSQEDVELLTGISVKTISRLENGYINNPSINMLLDLSNIYGEDIISLYLKCTNDAYYLYNDIIKEIHISFAFLDREVKEMTLDKIKILENKAKSLNIVYEKELLKIFLEYMIDFNKYKLKDNYESLSSEKDKKIKFSNQSYSDLELRILTIVASIFNGFRGYERIDILKFAYDNATNKKLKFLAINNYINKLYVDNKYQESLELINKTFSLFKESYSLEILTYLYYNKFLCEHEMGLIEWKESLNKALIFSESLKLDKVKEMISLKSSRIISG